MDKQEILRRLLDDGVLISPDFLENISEGSDYETILKKINGTSEIPIEITKQLETVKEQIKIPEKKIERMILKGEGIVKIVNSYEEKDRKKEVLSFTNYFRKRYDSLRDMLTTRQSLQESISISRLARKSVGEKVSIIGMVLEKSETKNGNVMLKIEDPTGVIKILITRTKEEVYNAAKDIMLDEVIGASGVVGDKIIFINSLTFPDIPVNHELKKSPDEAYAVFISDIHFGIKLFIKEDFEKLIDWLNCKYGTESQREIAKRVKYLFIVGDLVEGVGIYPGQEEDLDIKDVYIQYEELAKILKKIPEHIKIIICGGNHDALRMAEPQPIFDKKIAKGLFEVPNIIQVSNPAIVNIHSSENFPGFNVLMYHGGSFFHIAENVPSIRAKGGIARVDLIMKHILQKRHLAIEHGATLYIPDPEKDPLIVDTIPDIFVSGHIHQIIVSNYRNVTLVNSSCWVTQSGNQAKRGMMPHPGKIPIINLKTREVKIMDFLSEGREVLLKHG